MCAQPLKAIELDSKPSPELGKATLNHIHLRVDDLNIAQSFYERHFGFKPFMELPWASRSMRFLKNEHGFALVLETHPDKTPMPSWFHLGFQLTSREAVRDALSHLEKDGLKLLGEFMDHPGYSTFTIEDPDGYHLQIYWDAEDPAHAPD